ncbi:MAG: phage tail family protein [Clostridiales bacterium]|nr:phage tail family protein [Clostridiales bacterium]
MYRTVKIRIVRSDSKEFHIDGTDWRIPSDGLDGFGNYENDIATVDNAVGDGGIITSDRIAPKDRTIVAKSRNPVLNDILRRSALSFFNPKFWYKIYVTYMGVTRWCEGKIYRFDLPSGNVNRTMTMTVTFLCPNPFLKSYDNFGKNIASITGMCAFPYLCSMTDGTPKGITGGRFNFAKVIVLENDGDVDTFCQAVFMARGEVENPKLTINGNYVRVIDTMQKGEVIIIDFTKNPPTVQKNGANYIGHCDRTSAFDDMALVVGDSEVSFDADTGSNLLDVSIYYNKLYGAI